MIKRLHPFHLTLHVACALWLAACSEMPTHHATAPSARNLSHFIPESVRESELRRAWEGQPYDALLAAYGTPKLVMNVPGNRPLKTSVAVYGVNDEISQCIDAFSFIEHDQTKQLTVADYFCR